MKRLIPIILCVIVLAGCSRQTNEHTAVTMVSSTGELYLSREEQQTVYDTEAPKTEDVLDFGSSQPEEVNVDESSQPEIVSAPEISSSAPQVSQVSLDAASSTPEPSSSAVSVQAQESADPGESSSTQLQTAPDPQTQAKTQTLAAQTTAAPDEVRAVWMSYLTLTPMVQGKTKEQFTANIGAAFDNIKAMGLNTVFVQVRPFGDALYDSDYFPWSYILTGTEGQNPGYDPLAVMCELAHARGLRIEAWLNPYRVRATASQPMASDNQAKKWVAAGNDAALQWNGGTFYNPGNAQARQLIVNGVKEIVQNYPVDGIHFDDYFYPTADLAFDKATYAASGSSLSQEAWRRENVNILIRDTYAAIKAINPNCLFGVSPQGNIEVNYNQQFADVEKWLVNAGYLDYICPQLYYGYQNSTCPYEQTLQRWDSLVKARGIKLYSGIAAYKVGTTDQWAGAGKEEWVGATNILSKMVKSARGTEHYGGVAFYSYESLFVSPGSQMKTEIANLREILD